MTKANSSAADDSTILNFYVYVKSLTSAGADTLTGADFISIQNSLLTILNDYTFDDDQISTMQTDVEGLWLITIEAASKTVSTEDLKKATVSYILSLYIKKSIVDDLSVGEINSIDLSATNASAYLQNIELMFTTDSTGLDSVKSILTEINKYTASLSNSDIADLWVSIFDILDDGDVSSDTLTSLTTLFFAYTKLWKEINYNLSMTAIWAEDEINTFIDSIANTINSDSLISQSTIVTAMEDVFTSVGIDESDMTTIWTNNDIDGFVDSLVSSINSFKSISTDTISSIILDLFTFAGFDGSNMTGKKIAYAGNSVDTYLSAYLSSYLSIDQISDVSSLFNQYISDFSDKESFDPNYLFPIAFTTTVTEKYGVFALNLPSLTITNLGDILADIFAMSTYDNVTGSISMGNDIDLDDETPFSFVEVLGILDTMSTSLSDKGYDDLIDSFKADSLNAISKIYIQDLSGLLSNTLPSDNLTLWSSELNSALSEDDVDTIVISYISDFLNTAQSMNGVDQNGISGYDFLQLGTILVNFLSPFTTQGDLNSFSSTLAEILVTNFILADDSASTINEPMSKLLMAVSSIITSLASSDSLVDGFTSTDVSKLIQEQMNSSYKSGSDAASFSQAVITSATDQIADIDIAIADLMTQVDLVESTVNAWANATADTLDSTQEDVDSLFSDIIDKANILLSLQKMLESTYIDLQISQDTLQSLYNVESVDNTDA
ncbi:MAG: hypothetical protein S4CHLAM20_00700 [Chlamydiia bacterium]|nr:hypothetical protein [Chlamydiia bacterium]